VIHLLRHTFRYVARLDWDQISTTICPVYQAPTIQAAVDRFDEFADRWGRQYPAAVTLWWTAWDEFIAFLDGDSEIRKISGTTNAIESLNARYHRAVNARGHCPNDQAA